MSKKILVLAAHPDDETLGCGGTIRRLSTEGNDIQLLTFTDGESSRGKKGLNRNAKLDQVSKILGINSFTSADFPDNAMDSVPLLEICKFIESEVNYFPDIIFTHFQGDLNIDHQVVAKATWTVFRPKKGCHHKILSYFIPSSTDYNPYNYFNASTYYELGINEVKAKESALLVYDREIKDSPNSRSYENINNLMRVWGSEICTHYAEKFINIRELI